MRRTPATDPALWVGPCITLASNSTSHSSLGKPPKPTESSFGSSSTIVTVATTASSVSPPFLRMSIPLSSACSPLALEMMIGRVPCAGATGMDNNRAASSAGIVRRKTLLAPAAKLLARDVRKNFRRDQSSILMPPRRARAIYKRKGEIGSSRVRFSAVAALFTPEHRREPSRKEISRRTEADRSSALDVIISPVDSERIRYLIFLPNAKPASKRILVIAQLRAGRQLLQFLAIPSAQHHIIRVERELQSLRNLGHAPPPFFLPHPLEAAQSEIILIRFSVLVRKVRQLHRL